VANGDLSKKITVDVKGEILELKNTFNTMVDQPTRSPRKDARRPRGRHRRQARGQANVHDWGHLEGSHDNVNTMAANLTDQVRNIALS